MSTLAGLTEVDIKLDGAALSDVALSALEGVRVQQGLSRSTVCELTFAITRHPVAELSDISIGSTVHLRLPSHNGTLFEGEITAIEHTYEAAHGHILRLRCYDALHRLRKRQPVRTHAQVTPASLAREMAEPLGLAVLAEEDGPLSQHVIQYRQSDFDLLVDLCGRAGLYLTLRDDVLHLITLTGLDDTVELTLGKTLLEARLELNAEMACRSVLAKGWDTARVEAHESTAERTRLGREVDAEAPPDRFDASGLTTLTAEVFPDDTHARAVAQGELDQRTAREVSLRAVADGDPKLQPGTRVDLLGVAARFTGRYVVTSVEHRINRRTGFVSEFSTLPPDFERPASNASVLWGTITAVDDPERMGRVRARLAALGEVETDWMGVMAAGAGKSKGFVILPDVDDQVLVLFLGSDTSQAIVLGGLYGASDHDDYGVDGASVRRYSIATPGGQRLKLDDSGQCIRLENKGGSFVDLSPEKFLLHSAVPLEIEAPGHEVVIIGKTIDFRQA